MWPTEEKSFKPVIKAMARPLVGSNNYVKRRKEGTGGGGGGGGGGNDVGVSGSGSSTGSKNSNNSSNRNHSERGRIRLRRTLKIGSIGAGTMLLLLVFTFAPVSLQAFNIFSHSYDRLDQKYGSFTEKMRLEMLEEVKKMFYFGYDGYMKYAFPMDELDPIHCVGRGPDHENPSNININDVLGDYCLTLIDSLDTLAVLGNVSEFHRAIQLIIDHVSFDKENTVQVFEANIRLLGGLLSAHMFMEEGRYMYGGDLRPPWYTGQLLQLAHDLASRLLPAFQKSITGIPYPRVNLRKGTVDEGAETCTAGAGSLLLELGALSRLLGDPIYESMARRANRALWSARAKTTGLLGNVINAKTGQWIGRLSGLGAGLDSYFEYLLKDLNSVFLIKGDMINDELNGPMKFAHIPKNSERIERVD